MPDDPATGDVYGVPPPWQERRGSSRPAEELRPPPPGPAPGGQRWAGDMTYEDLAAAVLIAHQRDGAGGCLCGWDTLGRSFARHVAEVLRQAGALRG